MIYKILMINKINPVNLINLVKIKVQTIILGTDFAQPKPDNPIASF